MALRLTHDPAPNQPAPPVDWRFFLLGALLGLCIGVGLAVTDGLYSGSRVKFRRHLLYGALAGPVCGYIAFGLGGMLYSMLGGDPTSNSTNTVGSFLQQMVARTGSVT